MSLLYRSLLKYHFKGSQLRSHTISFFASTVDHSILKILARELTRFKMFGIFFIVDQKFKRI